MQSIFDVSVFYLDIFFTVKFETKLLTYNGLFFFFSKVFLSEISEAHYSV